jgi:hypothetical protein
MVAPLPQSLGHSNTTSRDAIVWPYQQAVQEVLLSWYRASLSRYLVLATQWALWRDSAAINAALCVCRNASGPDWLRSQQIVCNSSYCSLARCYWTLKIERTRVTPCESELSSPASLDSRCRAFQMVLLQELCMYFLCLPVQPMIWQKRKPKFYIEKNKRFLGRNCEPQYLSQYSLSTDWMTAVRSPAEASLYVQTSSESHPASCTMGTGFSPLGKCGQGVTLPRSRMSRSYIFSLPCRLLGGIRTVVLM